MVVLDKMKPSKTKEVTMEISVDQKITMMKWAMDYAMQNKENWGKVYYEMLEKINS